MDCRILSITLNQPLSCGSSGMEHGTSYSSNPVLGANITAQ